MAQERVHDLFGSGVSQERNGFNPTRKAVGKHKELIVETILGKAHGYDVDSHIVEGVRAKL
jgi:hypothetical protein